MNVIGEQIGNRIVWKSSLPIGQTGIDNIKLSDFVGPEAVKFKTYEASGKPLSGAIRAKGERAQFVGGNRGIVLDVINKRRWKERDWLRNWKDWGSWQIKRTTVEVPAGTTSQIWTVNDEGIQADGRDMDHDIEFELTALLSSDGGDGTETSIFVGQKNILLIGATVAIIGGLIYFLTRKKQIQIAPTVMTNRRR